MTKYNGLKNYETWNVSLWVRNDEALHSVAIGCNDYADFVLKLKSIGVENTPDGEFLADAKLDLPALNEVIKEIEE